MMGKKSDPERSPWDAAAIAAISPPTPDTQPPDLETWTMYRALVARQALTDAELTELGRLAQALGKTPAEVEVAHVVIVEASRRSEVISEEAEAATARQKTHVAECTARQALLDTIVKARWVLDHATYPEHAANLAAQQRCEAIAAAKSEIEALHGHFPELFGLPESKRSIPFDSLPNSVTDLIRTHGLQRN
jgi:hypothetical protein